jgi:intergrase/recombinase
MHEEVGNYRFLEDTLGEDLKIVNFFKEYYVVYAELKGKRNVAYIYNKFAKKLKKLDIHPDAVVSYFKRRGITPKHLRKWNATKLLRLRVPESIVDFIQGRTSGSVLTQHYLAKLNLAITFYTEAVDELVKSVKP